MKIKNYKKKIISLLVLSLFSFLLGFFSFNYTQPNWEMIWKIDIEKKFKESYFLNFPNEQLKNEQEITLFFLIKNAARDYVDKNKNFKNLNNIFYGDKILRFRTSNENIKENLKIYINQLNKFISKNLISEFEDIINNQIKVIEEKIDINIKNLEYLSKIAKNYDLNMFFQKDYDMNDLFQFNSNGLDFFDKNSNIFLSKNFYLKIDNIHDLEKFISIYKNPLFKKKIIENDPHLVKIQITMSHLNSNKEIIQLISLKDSINRQASRLFLSLSSMSLAIALFLTYIGLFPYIKNFLKKIK